MAAGAFTLNARSDFASTSTLPNHTSMLTGRPAAHDDLLPNTAHHGWLADSRPDEVMTLHGGGNPNVNYKASLFDVAHDHGRRTCMYADKTRFELFELSYDAAHGAADLEGEDNGPNKIDLAFIVENSPEQLVSTAEADLTADKCDVAFIHIGELDVYGHDFEWASPTWYQALDRVDAWVERLSRVALTRELPMAFLLTGDHGGQAEVHDDPRDPSNYTVPFFAAGPKCVPSSDAYALVGDVRTNPRDQRPSYSDASQPIRNGDISNVALGMLGLPAIPGSLMRGLLVPQ